MKCNYKNILLTLLFLATAVNIHAKNIYLSSTGLDSNDGLTTSTAVKTLSKALTLSSDNDNIILADILDITTESGITFPNKNLTLQGSDRQSSGFDGKGQTLLLRLDGISSTISFKNLTFKNGSGNDGAGLYVRSSNVKFEDCDFVNNIASSGKGGAIIFNASTAEFSGCNFSGNKCIEGSSIAITGGNLTLANCIFENNDAGSISNSKGGAISVNPIQDIALRVTQSLFRNNKVGQKGGCIYIINNAAGKTVTSHVESCSFINNIAPESGAGIIFDKSPNPIIATIVNCTFYGNTSLNGEGPAILLGNGNENSRFDLINCTVTQNECKYNGAVRFTRETDPSQKNIHNCIFENNTNANGYRDGAWQTSAELNSTNHLNITNSFIGQTDLNKADYPRNYLNYYLGATTSEAIFTEYNEAKAYIPVSNLSEATTFGDSRYLQTLGITTDQIGTLRQYKDGKCTIGAIEVEPAPESEKEVYQHFIIYGQSHSSGQQSYPSLSTEPVEGNYMLGNQIWIDNGQNPENRTEFCPLIAKNPYSYIKNPTAPAYKNLERGMGECPLIGAVNHIQLKTKNTEYESKIIATSCGVSGTAIEELAKENTTGRDIYRRNFQEAINAAAEIARRNKTVKLVCPAIFWLQGETNQKEIWMNTKDGYKEMLLSMKDNMQNDIMNKYGQTDKPAFITYQTSGAYLERNPRLEISTAQVEASNEYNDIVCAGPIYPVTYHKKGWHLDANGYRWFGEMLGKVYYKSQILGENFKPLQPKEYYKTENPKELKIRFLVPHLPLVFDDKTLEKVSDYGFEVLINGTKRPISSLRIDNDCVIITLSNDIQTSDIIEVIYAGINKKYGNLRDSDPYTSFFVYEDLDKTDENGVFIYERDDDVLTLRPSIKQPEDADGNVIYGKNYPLHNFCVIFHKELNAGELTYDPVTPITNHEADTKSSIYLLDNKLHIDLKDISINNVQILDISGLTVKPFGPCDTVCDNLTSLPSGVYVVRVDVGEKVVVAKVIKE